MGPTTRGFTAVLLGAAVLAGMSQTALAQDPSPEPTLAATPDILASEPIRPPIEVVVDCYSSPESVTVTNHRARPITVRNVGSTLNRRAGEPFRVRRVVKPGKSITWTFGTGKGRKRLSRSFIFDNESPREGVLVKTSKGTIKVRCADGTNVPAEPDSVAPSEGSQGIGDGLSMDALDLLATLAIEPAVEGGYDRELFRHWIDEDGDGCDTREEVLASESLIPVSRGAGCSIEGGAWFSAFDGDTLTNPSTLDINHTVPLKEAWRSGAHAWSPARREQFANDLRDDRTLQAVSSGANRQQGDSDPAVWLPADREVACDFVIDWVAIKATWGLSVDEQERESIETTLRHCADRNVTVVPQQL